MLALVCTQICQNIFICLIKACKTSYRLLIHYATSTNCLDISIKLKTKKIFPFDNKIDRMEMRNQVPFTMECGLENVKLTQKHCPQ